MAVIELHPDIPDNIVRLPLTKPRQIREHYERGDLVILSDVRVKADFDRIAATEPTGVEVRKQKFAFEKRVNGEPEGRSHVWRRFFGDRAKTDPETCRDLREEITRVNAQVDALVREIFSPHVFGTELTVWKFLPITGENLHIDNLPNLGETTQARLFVNVDNKPRRWSVGRHWRHYAERHFVSAGLHELADDAFAFNGRLNHAAFGPSWSSCDEPRHLVDFDPGEVWLVNSALVAHQVRSGDRLCSTHYEYPYSDCIKRTETLPYLITALSRRQALAERGVPPVLLSALAFLDRQAH